MEEPLISVIIPIYNMEPYLARCLDSVLNNTYRNLEILCVDDGSRDRSLEILRQYEEKDSRIVVIAKENGGVSSARNAGLDRMTGEFVTFIDSDDFIHPQFFELLLTAEQKNAADIVMGRFQWVYEKDLPITFQPLAYDPAKVELLDCVGVFKNHFWGGYSTVRLIRSALVETCHFPEDLYYGEDGAFFSSIWETSEEPRCVAVKEQLYYYFMRDSSTSNSVPYELRVGNVKTALEKSKKSKLHEKIYFVQAICRLQRFQQYYINTVPKKSAVKALTKIMRATLFRLWRTGYYSMKEKLLYTILSVFPRSKSIAARFLRRS